MGNDATRKLDASSAKGPVFLERFSITLVVLEGGIEGTEFHVKKPRTVIGRGSDADWVVRDDAISKHHAAIEVGANGLRVSDLKSTNGTFVNDQGVGERADLKHGDQIRVGDVVFQCLIEPRSKGPRTFEVP